MTIISTTVGNNTLEEIRVVLIVKKRVQNKVLGCNLKNNRVISICFQGNPINITVNQTYVPTSNAEEAEIEWVYEDLQDFPELTSPRYVLFILEDSNAKRGGQEIPGITAKVGLGVQNDTGQRLTEFCQENTLFTKHPLPKTQEKSLHMGMTRWSIPKSD